MLDVIREKELEHYVGNDIRISREGIKGNILLANGKPKEGILIGVLKKDENGLYIKMFKPYWNEETEAYNLSKSSFMPEIYRVRDRDIIGFHGGDERIIRLSPLETK